MQAQLIAGLLGQLQQLRFRPKSSLCMNMRLAEIYIKTVQAGENHPYARGSQHSSSSNMSQTFCSNKNG